MEDTKPPSAPKEKKTRRRLRLSCVECTKRRQKCDRKYPCALCVSRGVQHLCRWETVPVARPPPARPPIPPLVDHDQAMESLRARIAYLEKALDSTTSTKSELSLDALSTSSPSASSVRTLASTDATTPGTSPAPDLPSPFSDPSVDDEKEPPYVPLFHLAPTLYATTSALAQLALGHHGEYVGRGSLICSLHSISTGNTSRFLYANSTDSTCAFRENIQGPSSNTLLERVEALIRCIPPVSTTMAMLHGFFAESNWSFGIPEEWFLNACSQMWSVLEYPGPHGFQINANWLSLLFAILAYAPNRLLEGHFESDCSDHYFMCSMTARRIAEDDFLNKPNVSLMVSAADGTVLGCLAIPILCNYLSQRGRVSEAWKLLGNGIRNAEGVGMHRDPEWKQWQVMSKDEILLRRRAWWGLYIYDRFYSFILGRPHMLRRECSDVMPPSPINLDGSRNRSQLAQSIFITLVDLAGEAAEKCLSPVHPGCSVILEMDAKLDQWEDQLPAEYHQYRDEVTLGSIDPVELSTIDCQRFVLLSWYITIRTKLHIAALTGSGRPMQLRKDILECRKRLVLLSMRLIKFQCENYEQLRQLRLEPGAAFRQTSWFFEGCFSLFEMTVALLTTLTRWPWRDKTMEADELAERVINVLTDVTRQETGKKGEIARMGVEVVRVLHQESWWRSQVSGGMVPPPLPSSTFYMSPIPPGPYDTTNPSSGYEWFTSATYSNIFGLEGVHS